MVRVGILVSDFRRKSFSFSPLDMILGVGLSYIAFIMLRCVPSVPAFLRVFFIMIGYWIFVKWFFCIHWDGWGFLGDSVVKNLPTKQEKWAWSLGWEDPLERKWQPTPAFLPGISHGQRSLAGYSPWGHKRVQHDLVTKQQQSQWLMQRANVIFKNENGIICWNDRI